MVSPRGFVLTSSYDCRSRLKTLAIGYLVASQNIITNRTTDLFLPPLELVSCSSPHLSVGPIAAIYCVLYGVASSAKAPFDLSVVYGSHDIYLILFPPETPKIVWRILNCGYPLQLVSPSIASAPFWPYGCFPRMNSAEI